MAHNAAAHRCVAVATNPSLADFVKSADQTVHAVLGNQAGDADTIVSTIALAHVDHLAQQQQHPIRKTPVLSIPRADLSLRRETVLLLDLAGVHSEHLDSLLDLDNINNNRIQDVTLVDHNRLTLQTNNCQWNVVEILDHHYDEGAHEHVVGKQRNVAYDPSKQRALVASTCTLIAERMFASLKKPYPSDLALVLLGVILLDTVNMSPEAGKGTERDQSAIETLLQDTDWSTLSDEAKAFQLTPGNNTNQSAPIDTEKLFRYLSDSKFDIEFWKELSVQDALRLDYKRFQAQEDGRNGQEVFGASSVLLPMTMLFAKEQFETSVLDFMQAQNIPLLAVLAITGGGTKGRQRERELALCGAANLVDDMARFLLQEKASTLQLQEQARLPLGDGTIVRHFAQGNVKASRKQVAPVMLEFYTGRR